MYCSIKQAKNNNIGQKCDNRRPERRNYIIKQWAMKKKISYWKHWEAKKSQQRSYSGLCCWIKIVSLIKSSFKFEADAKTSLCSKSMVCSGLSSKCFVTKFSFRVVFFHSGFYVSSGLTNIATTTRTFKTIDNITTQ